MKTFIRKDLDHSVMPGLNAIINEYENTGYVRASILAQLYHSDIKVVKHVNQIWLTDDAGVLLAIVDLKEAPQPSPINKFAFFCYNWTEGFIGKVWKGNDILIEHLQEKFLGIIFNYQGKETILRFYIELDVENRRKLEQWIELNYNPGL